MDRFQCAECGGVFFFDLEFEGMTASPGEKVALACPLCEHQWSYYRPEDTEVVGTVH